MRIPIVPTKLHIPQPKADCVVRLRLFGQLNEGLHRKLTVISAATGYGKTTLVSEWLAACKLPAGWLSLDAGDNDPVHLFAHLIHALQSVLPDRGEGLLRWLQAQQAPSPDTIVAAMLHHIPSMPAPFILVLDDYQVLESESLHKAVAYFIERMPAHMHVMITTREEPCLPLSRLRVQHQLTEIRAVDLRFTSSETAELFAQVQGLDLSTDDINQLQFRTEGWIAGLQLAALSLQGRQDATDFIRTSIGTHTFVVDYLLEEVLQRQPESVQSFLMRTSILDRMCGSLCDAMLGSDGADVNHLSGQETLEYLEHANLFLVPLDHERRWYRYHHLFADLLRQRLYRKTSRSAGNLHTRELHRRASQWFEHQGLDMEAFRHAAAARDVDRAAKLLEGKGVPLLFRGGVAPQILDWLDSLSEEELNASPSLWVMYASGLLMMGRLSEVEQKVQAADQVLMRVERDEGIRDLIGHISSIRASLAVSQHDAETILAESLRALEYVHPDNLPVRTATAWTLGYAYQLQGKLDLARKYYSEAQTASRNINHVVISIMATIGLGHIQAAGIELIAAADTFRQALDWAGNPPLPAACEAHLGLARVLYEWNDLAGAEQHGQQAVQLAQQLDHSDRVVAGEVFLARVRLAQGREGEAEAILEKAHQLAIVQRFDMQLPYIAEVKAHLLFHQGDLDRAAQLVSSHELPLCQARIHLARGEAQAALDVLETLQKKTEENGMADTRLKVSVLQALARFVNGERSAATRALADILAIAEPQGCVRIFLDEGKFLAELLPDAVALCECSAEYAGRLLAECAVEEQSLAAGGSSETSTMQPLIEPLSRRELEVLRLIAQGLSNGEIAERLFLALSTVKGYNRNLFDKLQVSRRTEAVARARALGILQ